MRSPCPADNMANKTQNTSPAKKLRSIKRLLTFLQKKSRDSHALKKSLSVSSQQHISIPPAKSNLVVIKLPSIDIPPVHKENPKLNFKRNQAVSISPRKTYHPAIHGACQAMFSKHPCDLTPEEIHKFNFYKNHKIQIGEPLESEIIYLPVGGIRTCNNCGELT